MRLNKTRNLPASDKRSKIIFIFMQLNKGKTTMRIHLDCWKDCRKCNVRKKKSSEKRKVEQEFSLLNFKTIIQIQEGGPFTLNFCTAGTLVPTLVCCPCCTLTRRKILLSGVWHWWQTPSWEFSHDRGGSCRRQTLPGLLNLRHSGYESIEGNCMQMWPSVELLSFLQFRTVCSIFIQVT